MGLRGEQHPSGSSGDTANTHTNSDDARVLSDLHQGLRDVVQKMGRTTLPPFPSIPGSSLEPQVSEGWGCTLVLGQTAFLMPLPRGKDAAPLLLLPGEALLSSRLPPDTAGRGGICHIPDSVPCFKGPWQPRSPGGRHRVPADPASLWDAQWVQKTACSGHICATQMHSITSLQVKRGCSSRLSYSPFHLHHHF